MAQKPPRPGSAVTERRLPLQKARHQQRQEKVCREMLAFRMPRYDRLPEIELYMDQLIGFANQVLMPLSSAESAEELMLTKSMVNNYVKQRVIPPPEKKRYGRAHLAMLLILCPLKQVFSIPECVQLMHLAGKQSGQNLAQDYDAFCTSLENAVHQSFGGQAAQPQADGILPRMTQAVADKIFLQKILWCENDGE